MNAEVNSEIAGLYNPEMVSAFGKEGAITELARRGAAIALVASCNNGDVDKDQLESIILDLLDKMSDIRRIAETLRRE